MSVNFNNRRASRSFLAAPCVAAVLVACLPTSQATGAEKTKNYSIAVRSEPGQINKNGAGAMVVAITPKGEWKIKLETPFKAALTASAGLQLEKNTLTAKDFVDAEAKTKVVKAPFKAAAGGAQHIAAKLTFFLCNPDICKRHKDEVRLDLAVR